MLWVELYYAIESHVKDDVLKRAIDSWVMDNAVKYATDSYAVGRLVKCSINHVLWIVL